MTQRPTYEELEQRIKELETEAVLRNKGGRLGPDGELTYQALLEGLDDIVWTVDLNMRTTYVSPSIEKKLGFTPEERMAQDPADQMSPASYARMIQLLQRELNRENEPGVDPDRRLRVEVEYYHKDGRALWFENVVCGLRDEKGVLRGIQGVSRDISERKRAEEALRASKELFEKTFVSQLDAIFILDAEVPAKIVDCNPAAATMFGYTRSEMRGRNVACLHVNEDVLGKFQETLYPAVKKSGLLHMAEFQMKRKDGAIFPTEHSVIPLQDEKGERIGWVSVVRDITYRKRAEVERKRIEAKLQQSQRLEAIATLAGGIAHQFNNALTPIIGNIDLLEMTHSEDEEVMASLKHMKASGRHMADLTRQLLAYARGGKYHPRAISLTDFVTDTLTLIGHTLAPQVRVETDLPSGIMKVEADPTQMQMVLSALIANSNEAMEGPGRIRISARNVDLDQAFIRDQPGLKPGPYVCISVHDDGKGMDKETRARIFEPFFTTHFMGRGLGMASVYGIVRNHDGAITVESELGKGTAVRIYLPGIVPEAREQTAGTREQPWAERAGGAGNILVIEDDKMVMELTRSILERLGYRVLEAGTGKRALEIAGTFDGTIELAILDIKLPDISGNQLYPQIMATRPGLKVLVCSGYAIDGPAREILNKGAQGFIQKPFSLSALAEKLTEVLIDTDDAGDNGSI